MVMVFTKYYWISCLYKYSILLIYRNTTIYLCWLFEKGEGEGGGKNSSLLILDGEDLGLRYCESGSFFVRVWGWLGLEKIQVGQVDQTKSNQIIFVLGVGV